MAGAAARGVKKFENLEEERGKTDLKIVVGGGGGVCSIVFCDGETSC